MGIFSFVKPGKQIFKTITSVEPKVNKTKLDTAKSNLAIATQKRKGAEAKLAQTLFEGKNKSFKKQDDFTFSPKTGRSKKVSEQKAKGGRVGLKRGTNLQKIKKTFSSKSPVSRMTGKKKKKGFPDMSGDGKITQKDILIAKGVIPKPKKKVI